MTPSDKKFEGEACHIVRDYVAHFANPIRLRILCNLIEGEASVGDLAEATGARQPSVSQHLNLLRLAGIVALKRKGSRHLYHITDPVAEKMMRFLFEISDDLVARDAAAHPNADHD